MNKRKLVLIVLGLSLLVIGSYWGLQVFVRYQVLQELRNVASVVQSMNQAVRIEVPPNSAVFKREMLGKVQMRWEIGPFWSVVYSLKAGYRLTGDKPIRIASHFYPDESTAGYLNMHFQYPLSLRTRLRLSREREGIFTFHLDPFGTRQYSMGPGVELWMTDGLNVTGNFSPTSIEAQSDFKDLGFIWRGKGLRFSQGRFNYKEKLHFEGEGVEWFYSSPKGLRESKRVDNVKGEVTLENGTPHVRIEMMQQGKKLGTVHFYSKDTKDWWLEGAFTKDTFNKNLDEGWPLLMKRLALASPLNKTLSN